MYLIIKRMSIFRETELVVYRSINSNYGHLSEVASVDTGLASEGISVRSMETFFEGCTGEPILKFLGYVWAAYTLR